MVREFRAGVSVGRRSWMIMIGVWYILEVSTRSITHNWTKF
jgi:hypothetical protein